MKSFKEALGVGGGHNGRGNDRVYIKGVLLSF